MICQALPSVQWHLVLTRRLETKDRLRDGRREGEGVAYVLCRARIGLQLRLAHFQKRIVSEQLSQKIDEGAGLPCQPPAT